MRVAVIGCGVVGASVGWHLARRGIDVSMFEAADPGSGVTNWSFSWVNASNKTETRAYFDLNVAGMAAHRDLAIELGAPSWWHPTGHLRWSDDAASAGALFGAVEHLRSWGYDVELWDAERVLRLLEPDLRFTTDGTQVAFARDEGWVDGHELVTRLIADAVNHGAAIHAGCSVSDIVVSGSRVVEVVVSGEERHAVDAVVNAAGPAARDVATMVGRTLPMRDEPGLVARMHCERVPVRRAMHAPRVELRPDGQDGVVLHSREIDALIEPGVDITDLWARLHRLAIDVAPTLRTATPIDARVAWRPIPIDGFPSVGRVDVPAGYYEAVTHSGITLAAIVGRLLAQEIVDGAVHDLIAPYRPGRFANTSS